MVRQWIEPRRGQWAVHWAPSRGAAVAAALGIPALPAPNRWVAGPETESLWVAPTELLVVTEEARQGALQAALETAVAGSGAVVDLSANRIAFRLTGPSGREVLRATCPVDVDPGHFAPGHLALTLVAGVPVILQMLDPDPSYRLWVRPSFQDFLGRWLDDAAIGVAALDRLR